MIELLVPAILFVFGLLFGSFLNVVVHRLPRQVDIWWKRSSCPACGAPVVWHDNLPLVSYLWLRGRCRSCGGPISLRYPAVELTTGLVFAGAGARWGLTATAGTSVLFACLMIALALIDYDHQILPNALTLPGAVAGVALSFVDPGITPAQSLIGALVGGGGLYAVAWAYRKARDREGMGMGDVKMMLLVGAFLGWKGAFLTVFIASLGGSLVGLLLIALGGEEWEYAMPFGTFLAAAAVITDWFGPRLLEWYWTLVNPVV